MRCAFCGEYPTKKIVECADYNKMYRLIRVHCRCYYVEKPCLGASDLHELFCNWEDVQKKLIEAERFANEWGFKLFRSS